MSNFSFTQTDFPELYADEVGAEQHTFVSPLKVTGIFCRSTLEKVINWFYVLISVQ